MALLIGLDTPNMKMLRLATDKFDYSQTINVPTALLLWTEEIIKDSIWKTAYSGIYIIDVIIINANQELKKVSLV